MTQARLDQIVTGTLSFADAFGNPIATPPAGDVVWAVSDSSIADIEVSVDGLSARLVPTGVPGNVTITATLGALVATADIEIGAGSVAAMTLTITVTDPE